MIQPDIQFINKVLHEVGVPLVLWGEHAMREYGIPTALFVSPLFFFIQLMSTPARGHPCPGRHAPYRCLSATCQRLDRLHGTPPDSKSGILEEGLGSRRFHYPGRESDLAHELLILPTSFVGLGPAPALNTMSR